MKIGIPIVHTSVKIFRLIHKNFTVLAKVQKSKEKERKEKKKTVQTKSIGKSPFRSVPIRRINILEKRDSIPRIGSNRFFSCFFKVTATFQPDRPSLLDPIRFSTPYIYIYTHLIHLNAISIFPWIELFGVGERRMLFTSRLHRGWKMKSWNACRIGDIEIANETCDRSRRAIWISASVRTDLYYQRTTLSFHVSKRFVKYYPRNSCFDVS